jgi:N-methylhydantoinase A
MNAQIAAGVDVGGTFTDVVVFDAAARSLRVTKVPSTPANQSEGVRRGLTAVLPDLGALGKLVHGTTVSTNTMRKATARASRS